MKAVQRRPSYASSLLLLLKRRSVWIIIVVAIGLFYGGYQLAIYQEDNGDSLLPHFDFTPSQATNCDNDLGCSSFQPSPCPSGEQCMEPAEPVIYLYPTHAEKVSVKVGYAAGFSRTVPQYNAATGWSVLAQPNGQLTDQMNGQNYPYLVWEGNPAAANFAMNSGFVVAGANSQAFLQRQLTSMGLNQSEVSSFIAYWLPKMQSDPYNVIHFAGSDYTKLAPLTITPKPDALLRVFMAFKSVPQPVKVTPQLFPTFQRSGFTAVEWGGTKLP